MSQSGPFASVRFEIPRRRVEYFELSIVPFTIAGFPERENIRLLRLRLKIEGKEYFSEKAIPQDDTQSVIEYLFDNAKATLLRLIKEQA